MRKDKDRLRGVLAQRTGGASTNNLAEWDFDEANFWQSSAKSLFANPEVGMPFLFKLKRPCNHIAGGGFFVANSVLPLSLAWDIFGEKNGASSVNEPRELIGPHLAGDRRAPDIGCTVLSNPFLIDGFSWMNHPPDWSSNIVRGKYHDTRQEAGAEIWSRVPGYLTLDPARR